MTAVSEPSQGATPGSGSAPASSSSKSPGATWMHSAPASAAPVSACSAKSAHANTALAPGSLR